MKTILTFGMLLLLPSICLAAQKVDPAALPFLEGLDAVEKGDYGAATKSFSDAIEADSESPHYRIARAVSYILAEKRSPKRT